MCFNSALTVTVLPINVLLEPVSNSSSVVFLLQEMMIPESNRSKAPTKSVCFILRED